MQETIHPVYFIHGTETFIIDEALKEITRKAISEEDIEFNVSVYDMEETPVNAAIEEAETMPFLGDRKLIICKNAYFLSTTNVKTKIDHSLDRLEEYVHNPAPHSVFVIVSNYEKIDKRKKLPKKLLKESAVIEANVSNPTAATRFVEESAMKFGVKITSNGCGRLLQMTGVNLLLLHNEIEKMSSYVGEGGIINEDVVDLLVAKTLEQSVFTLVDKVMKRQHKEAFGMLQDLFRQKEEPIKILSLLTRQIRIILHVSILEKEGVSQKDIAARLKLHPYAVKVAMQQSRQFSQRALLLALEKAANADFSMKTGNDQVMTLEVFISSL
ncbi:MULTISPECIES: DNA polymerase III subunit delta [Pseudobacillus]|uniref:DNA polymerase III subunit delta n=1 Tax=Pseudobacillus TaxID=108525 RepID=UPI003879EDFB